MTADNRCKLLLVCLLVAGCERYSDQPVFVYGQALRGEGAPLPEARLSFDRREETFGSSLSAGPPPTFAPYGTVTTQADGTFALELPAKDVEQLVSTELRRYRFRVSTPLDEKGQAAFVSFTFNAQDVELPALRPWDADLSVSPGSLGSCRDVCAPSRGPREATQREAPCLRRHWNGRALRAHLSRACLAAAQR